MSEKSNHAGKPIPEEPSNVACSVCLREIPESVAVSSEADDYTQHFCGITCYQKWREENDISHGPATHSKSEDS